jgi:hypothetical protein
MDFIKQVIIFNVPFFVCDQCGETSYNDEVAKRLEQIVKNITEAASAEITEATETIEAQNYKKVKRLSSRSCTSMYRDCLSWGQKEF